MQGIGKQQGIVSDYVKVSNDGLLHCQHLGLEHSGPPILLIHGNRDNHSHFKELAEWLAQDRHILAVDLRGHGRSTTLDRPMSLELLAADIRAVATHYQLPEVILAGHSLGSVAAITVASKWPKLVPALVLMGAAATFELKFKRPDMPLTEETFPAFIREANRRAAPLFFHENHPDIAARVTAAWSSTTLAVHRNLVAFRHPDLRRVIPRLKMPTLIIAGQQDRCTTVEQAWWLHRNHPRSELTVVPNTGHFMYMEEPEVVASRINEFLGRVGQAEAERN